MTTTPDTDSERPADPAAPALTHACVRCGAAVPLTDALCAACNPAGLEQPAASQAHGTVFLGIGLAVVGLAVALTIFVGGVGPFRAALRDIAPHGGRAAAHDRRGEPRLPRRPGQLPRLGPDLPRQPPGGDLHPDPRGPGRHGLVFEQRVTGLGATERTLAVDCSR